MKALNEYVYGVLQAAVDLQAIKDNIYFSFLPSDWDRNQDSIVYETEIQESYSTLHDDNYAQSVRLRIKVLSKISDTIYDLSDDIKDIVLLAENSDLRDIQFVRNNYLFDERLDVHSFSNDFDIYLSKSAIERINISGGYNEVKTVEKDFDGTDNFILLPEKIEEKQLIAVVLGGDVQNTENYTFDNSGATTKIIYEDPADALEGYPAKVIYLD